MTDLRSRLLSFLSSHRGRANAITRDEVLFAMQAWEPGLTDRALRELYADMPVCSTDSKPRGLYLLEEGDRDGLESFLTWYASHVGPVKAAARRAVFYRERPDLRPDAARQMELPL